MTRMKSKLIVYCVAVVTVLFVIAEVEARRGLGGGGRGGFSRHGIAGGGGFGGRSHAPRAGTFERGATHDRMQNRPVPSGDRMEQRQEFREERREDVGNYANERQEDRQDFIEDNADDWDRHHLSDEEGAFIAGALVGGAVGAAASSSTTYVTTLPCSTAPVVADGVSYYNCSSTWYQRAYSGSQVTYIVSDPPPGY